MIWGNRGGREIGMGRGRSVYKQPGTRVDEDHTTQRGGIPSKSEGLGEKGSCQGKSARGNWQGEFIRGCDMA